jgi:dTDP-glucose 4,6-dehydratase
LGALHPTRDFSYVADTVAGFISALRSPRAVGKVVNLGSGFEISIGDTARLIAELMAVDLEILTDQVRIRPDASEVERLWADTAKARELLDWLPEFGGLDGFRRGLSKTVEWFRDPQQLRSYRSDAYNL